ncbi:MAG: universal stress protein [Dehalococcoidia bacterium]
MRVLAPMDGSTVGEGALAAVALWALASGADVHLLTVLQPSRVHETMRAQMAYVAGPAAVPISRKPRVRTIEDRTQALSRARQEAEDYLSLMAHRYLSQGVHTVNVEWSDDVSRAICELAETLQADFIVVGTHARTGISHALLGSIAEEVIREASVPVLVVRNGVVDLRASAEGNDAAATGETSVSRRMAGKERLIAYLRRNDVPFMLGHHRETFSAIGLANLEGVPEQRVAKVLAALADNAPVMLVVPAGSRVDRDKVRRLVGARDVHLITEESLADHFPDCEVGALHPFGNLYGVAVYLDRALASQSLFAFLAGSHSDTLWVAPADFIRLVAPVLCDIQEVPQ